MFNRPTAHQMHILRQLKLKYFLVYLVINRCPCSSPKETVFEYGLSVAQGQRPYMEDRFAIKSTVIKDVHYTIYGIFDGHGGDQAAQFCVEHLPQMLISNHNFTNSIKNSLFETFVSVDESFTKVAKAYNLECGTTANVIVTNGTSIITANTGDSRSILVKDNGISESLSNDHKPNREDEKERIEKAGGRVITIFTVPRVQGLLAVSRAIGDVPLKPYVIADPEIISNIKSDNDLCIIMGSDGLWDVIPNGLAGVIARKILITDKGNCSDVADKLVKTALEKESSDNVYIFICL